MSPDDYEFSGTLTFSNEELKKELHQIALNGLKAFVDAYEKAYLGTTILGNGIKISVEDNTRFPYATLGASATDAKELYDWTVTMKDCYDEAKSISETYIGNTNPVDVVSEVTTQISNLTKIATDIVEVAGKSFGKKAGIVSSVIGFAGAAIATFDGTTKAEKDALVKSGIDLAGEGLKLALKAIPVVGVVGSLGIDVGVDLAKILVENIYDTLKNIDNTDGLDSSFAGKYREGLVSVDSAMDMTLSKYNIPKFTSGDDNVYNKQSNIFMNALTGNDTVKNDGTKVTIYGNYGNDFISNGKDEVSINGGSGNDTIYSTGRVESTFTNGKSKYYYRFVGNVNIDGSTGDDYISSNSQSSKIYGGLGNDSIDNYGDGTTIDSGDGDDYINNFVECYQTSYYHYSGGDGVSIYAGNGNDKIFNTGWLVTINGGIGNDYISNGERATVYGEEGNDTISNSSSLSVLYGGTGEDRIINDATKVTIDGDDSDDTIKNEGSDVTIDGGNGDDFIENEGSNVTIRGGKGDDKISNKSYDGVVYLYESGDGNDVISGYTQNDTLKLENFLGASFSNNGYVRINAQSGQILLTDFKSDVINVNGNFVEVSRVINGTNESEVLEIPIDNVTVNALNGNDTINNRGKYVSVVAGEGNDYISNWWMGESSTIVAGKGNDYISNSGVRSTILGGDNLDTINNYASLAVIDGGNDDDSILNRITDVTIDGGNGNDYIENFYRGDNVSIYGGEGTDSIYNGNSSNVTINGGIGNDYINNFYSSNNELHGGYGDDYIDNNSSNAMIYGDKGDDYIKLDIFDSKNNCLIYLNGDGDDTVSGFMYDDTLQIVGASYTTLESGDDLIVSVGNGSIKLLGNRNRKLNIQGTLAADTISTVETAKNIINTKSNTIISGTKYADTISNTASRVTIEGAADNDSITSVGDRVSISSGTGNDTLYSDVAGSIESGSNVTINGGVGDDYISNDSAYSKLEGNDGKDTITNYGWNTTIDGGTGNDIINNFKAFDDEGNNVSINGGAGNDSITSTATKVSIDGGDGKDTIWAWSSNIFVDGGADNDYIYAGNYEKNTTIYGSYGDDTINNFNSKSYISGGVGNDLIYNDNQPNNIFLYTAGDGNDTIFGFASSDTIQINAGKLSNASVSGSNIRLTIGNGSILLKDAKDKNITVKDSAGTHTFKNTYLGSATVPTNNFTNGNDYYSNSIANITLNALGGNDIIYNHANKVLIKGGAGNDDLTSFSDSTNVTLKGEAGNDTICSWSGKSYIEGDGGADYIYSGGSNHTVIGGKGNDLISLMAAAHYTIVKYASGDGKDTIYGLDSDDTLQITGAKYTTAKSGSDLIIGVGNDSISVVGGANVAFKINGTLKSNIADGISVKNSIVTASKNFKGNKIDLANYAATKVNASAVTKAVSIVGTAAANSLKGGKGADTISGGAGNDTVSLGGGKDVYIYSGGNDVIQDYTAGQDKIKLLSSTISGASISGNDVVLKVGSGSITVKKGKGKYITTVDSKGNASVDIYDQSNGVQVKEIDNRYGSGVTLLSGGSGNDTIWNAEFFVSINGGAGDDWIDSDADNVTINGGSGSDSILTGNNYVSIYGGDGNDWIGNFEGYNVTINGGKGNDTINNYESSRTVIKYASGDGNDVISNINDNDTLQITGSTYTTMKSGSDVFFKVGNGSITVKNTVNSGFNIDFKSSSVSNSRTLDLMYDNNFITNELQIDDISEVTETNYSVGQIENSNNSNEFVMDSIVAATSFDKK